jgi:hypothetical protein
MSTDASSASGAIGLPKRPRRSSSQPPHLGQQQAIALLLPIEVGRLADAGLAADIRHWHSVGALLQDKRLLDVRKSLCLHRFRSS